MIIYVLVFILLSLLSIINYTEKSRSIYLLNILVVCVLILFSGTRYNIGGTDYFEYEYVYSNTPRLIPFFRNYTNLNQLYRVYSFEKGYLFLSSFAKTMDISFHGFTLMVSVVFYTLFIKGIRYFTKDNYTISFVIVVFLSKMLIYNTFISMRQSIAIAIFTFSWKYLESRDWKKYFIYSLMAVSMHSTAIFMFPLYFIWNIDLTRKKIVIINVTFLLVSLIGQVSNIPFKSLDYLSLFMRSEADLVRLNKLLYGTKSTLNIIHILEYYVLTIILIFNFKKLNYKDNQPFYIKLFVYMIPIFTIFSFSNMISRMKDYFIISFAFILRDLFSKNKKKFLIYFLLLIVYSATIYFRFILNFDGGSLIPYKSYIFK